MQLLVQIPSLLLYVVGIVFAFVYRQQSRTPSMLALLACAFLLCLSLVMPFISNYLLYARSVNEWSIEKLGHILGGVSIVSSILSALGNGLLLTAIFIDRKPRPDLPLKPSIL